jgi:hypothetical protein
MKTGKAHAPSFSPPVPLPGRVCTHYLTGTPVLAGQEPGGPRTVEAHSRVRTQKDLGRVDRIKVPA